MPRTVRAATNGRPGVHTCPNGASCPFIADAGHDTYLVIGATTTPQHAAEHGGGVGPTETAVLVPKPVIDALSQLLRDELAPLSELGRNPELPGEDDEFYIPGHVYVSENGYWQFTCLVVAAGVALGEELALKDPDYEPRFTKKRTWMTVRPAGCWHDVTGETDGGGDD